MKKWDAKSTAIVALAMLLAASVSAQVAVSNVLKVQCRSDGSMITKIVPLADEKLTQ